MNRSQKLRARRYRLVIEQDGKPVTLVNGLRGEDRARTQAQRNADYYQTPVFVMTHDRLDGIWLSATIRPSTEGTTP